MVRYIQDKIEWHRMKKIAFDHPYFDIKEHSLSELAAERILCKRQIPDVKEVLRKVRTECNIIESTQDEHHRTSGTDRHQHIHNAPSLHLRRVAIASAVVLAIISFFTLTKPGTALAHEISKIIVKVFNGTLISQNTGMPDEVAPIDFSQLPAEYANFEEIAQATERAIVVPDDSDGKLVDFFVDIIDPEMMVISSKYVQDGKSYRFIQVIHNENSLWSGAVSTITDELESVTLPLGITAYLGQMEDGTIYAEAFGAGYDLNVSSNDLTLPELSELIKHIQLIKID